jgi:hypothetical protein
MKTVLLAMVEIDDNGRMRLYPVQEEYDFIYRAAAGVDWSKEGGFLYFREPNKLPYSMCFKQIVSAVSSEYGDVLEVEPATKWLNVPAEFQEEIMRENENRRPNQSPEPTRFARGSSLNVSRNMKSGARTVVSLVPLAFQGLAALSAVTVISFFQPRVVNFLKNHEGKLVVPGPTRLLVEHAGAAKMVVVALFAVSALTYLVTRSKMKEEADQLVVQGAVYGAVWYTGIIYVGGVLMSAALPYLALNSQ